jgi:hypothetical protein
VYFCAFRIRFCSVSRNKVSVGPAPVCGRAGSIRLLIALRNARLAQAFDHALVLRVEGRIVRPVDAGPTLHGEAGIDFLQLAGGALRLLVQQPLQVDRSVPDLSRLVEQFCH